MNAESFPWRAGALFTPVMPSGRLGDRLKLSGPPVVIPPTVTTPWQSRGSRAAVV